MASLGPDFLLTLKDELVKWRTPGAGEPLSQQLQQLQLQQRPRADSGATRTLFGNDDITKLMRVLVPRARQLIREELTAALPSGTLKLEHTFSRIRALAGDDQREVHIRTAMLKKMAVGAAAKSLPELPHRQCPRPHHKHAVWGGGGVDLGEVYPVCVSRLGKPPVGDGSHRLCVILMMTTSAGGPLWICAAICVDARSGG